MLTVAVIKLQKLFKNLKKKQKKTNGYEKREK